MMNRHRLRRYVTFTLVFFLVLLSSSNPEKVSSAGPWYVAPGGDDTNDCLSPTTECSSINGALSKPGFLPGDTIFVTADEFTNTGSEVVSIDKDCVLSGGWDPSFSTQVGFTTLNGENTRRGISISSAVTSEIDRFIVLNSINSGIRNASSTLTIRESKIFSNNANSGGGISNWSGTLYLLDSEVYSNTAEYGGGIGNANGTFFCSGSTISGNTATSSGGGLTTDGEAFINNCTISGNQASFGAGIQTLGFSASTRVNSSTISTNSANNSGGGIRASGGDVYLKNTILYGNSGLHGPDCEFEVFSEGYNILGETSGCTFEAAIGDQIGSNPNLGALSDNGGPSYTHALLDNSPAIGAGNPAGCKDQDGLVLDEDQRGAPRLGRCDIGSFEAQSYKDVNQLEASPFDTLSYEIAFRNWSGSSQPYTITDTLHDEVTFVPASLTASYGTPSYSAGVISWGDLVPPNELVTISFDVEVGSILGTLTNSVTINDGSGDITRSATTVIDAPICSVTKYAGNPVLTEGAPGSWDDDHILHPTVILDGSTYKMWYAGNDDTNVNHIGLATSPDGYVWTKQGSNPVLSPGAPGSWDENGVSRPSVILDGATYKMWFTGVDSGGVIQIGYATSPDGIAWTKDPGNPVLSVGSASSWESDDVSGPTVLKDSGTYHMWYAGNGGSNFRIGHATSSDGITWIKDPANPVLDVGPTGAWDWLGIYSPEVIKIGDSYKLWYSGETLPLAWQTGYAESPDGTNWTRKGMLIPEGLPGTFDTKSADHPAVLIDGTSYRIWHAGIDDGGTYTIGHAEAQLCSEGPYTLYLPLIMKGYPPGPTCPADYFDDFSDPDSGWLIYEDSEVKFGYTNDEYQIWLKQDFINRWVTPGAKASDYTAAVSARRLSGTDALYGLLFGISDDWNELYEVIIGDTYYDIWKYDYGWTLLATNSSSDINTGTAWNRIKVIRDGSEISLFINDAFQTTIYDSSLTGLRRVGVSSYSGPGSGIDFRFDDFALYPADCGAIAADVGNFEWDAPEFFSGDIPPKPEREQ